MLQTIVEYYILQIKSEEYYILLERAIILTKVIQDLKRRF